MTRVSTAHTSGPRELHSLADRWSRLRVNLIKGPGRPGFFTAVDAIAISRCLGEAALVYLNVSKLGCDAIVVTARGSVCVPLPDASWLEVTRTALCVSAIAASDHDSSDATQTQEAQLGAEQVRLLLDTIWTRIVPLIARHAPQCTHVWWCPTGPATMLPVHLIGLSEAASASTGSLSPALVHSYAANGSLLVRNHFRPDRRPLAPVAVGMRRTPGLKTLERAADEAEMVGRRYTGAQVLVDKQATREAIIGHIAEADVVHLACHGARGGSDPLQAGFHLHDGALRIEELTQIDRRVDGGLAYLSLCWGAESNAGLLDEALSLAVAFQALGFRDVIANLWPVDDEVAFKVATRFHAALSTAAEGTDPGSLLSGIVHEMARQRPDDVWAWGGFVHYGAPT